MLWASVIEIINLLMNGNLSRPEVYYGVETFQHFKFQRILFLKFVGFLFKKKLYTLLCLSWLKNAIKKGDFGIN